MNSDLKKTIKNIQRRSLLIPNINSGGCCHFAKLLSRQLELRDIKYKVVFYDDYISLNNLYKAIINNELTYTCSHVALKIDKSYIDCDFISRNPTLLLEKESIQAFNINNKQLTKYANDNEWNFLFDLRKYHSLLNKIIKEEFDKYDGRFNKF